MTALLMSLPASIPIPRAITISLTLPWWLFSGSRRRGLFDFVIRLQFGSRLNSLLCIRFLRCWWTGGKARFGRKTLAARAPGRPAKTLAARSRGGMSLRREIGFAGIFRLFVWNHVPKPNCRPHPQKQCQTASDLQESLAKRVWYLNNFIEIVRPKQLMGMETVTSITVLWFWPDKGNQ